MIVWFYYLSQAYKNEIQLLMAVVKYKTRIAAPRRGVCSTWLSSLDPAFDSRVPVWVKRGTIQFPATVETPVIMVGPGKLMSSLHIFRKRLTEEFSIFSQTQWYHLVTMIYMSQLNDLLQSHYNNKFIKNNNVF